MADTGVPKEFPIVGIGASAGGLEAFKALIELLPVDTGLAFVIIQHLASGQESLLTDILSRFTKMPVLQVEDGMSVAPNHMYVIPPGSTMTLDDGDLKLNPKGKSLRPIDAFLSSLALERKTQAIGVVLSGTGTDGTEGLKAIKVEGGITFAQDILSAQYSGMPQSAISAETVDFVLSPDKIAKELSKIAKNPQLVRAEIDAQEPQIVKESGLRKIFTLLKLSFNVDFTHYKHTVVNRRITRRMVINNVDSITKYSDYLETHPTELQALFNDMLIGVTSFFREPSTFSILKEKIFPELLKNRVSREPIRIWIPGCSTGEEAYSFAISLQEFLEEKGLGDLQVQVFGTDVNEKNVDRARQGIYPKNIDANVSEARLNRFFSRFNGNYQIAKVIRDMCVFAKQDITADPPFSNMDLISCRNMLIYFDSLLQERIVPILHYALKPNGFLVLGESESIGKFTVLFEQVNKKGFIYTKKKAQPRVNFGFESASSYVGRTILKESVKKDTISLLREEMDKLLITEYVPAALLLNGNLDILVFRGNVTPYLAPESGQISFNIAKMMRKELRAEVQTAVYRAKKENKPVKEEAIRIKYGAQLKTVNIQVIPLRISQTEELFFLLLIEDVSSAAALLSQTIELTATPEGRENVKDSQIHELKEELASSKQSLQTIIETQEVTNEELRSAMEEVQSSNEELQSTNEELETAKEELQSSNEELTTLNDELKNRNQTLGRLNDNLANLTINIDSAVVMVDCDLKIRLFTPSAQKILSITPSDTGLPITNVRLAILIPDLEKIILDVIATFNAKNMEVCDKNGRSYELRVRPYIAQEKRVDGAVLSFIDVDVLKKHEDEIKAEKEKFRTLGENSPDIIARFDRNLRYLYVNSAVKELSNVFPKDFTGKTNQEAGLPKKFVEAWNKVLQNVIQTGKVEKGEFDFSSLEERRVYQYVIVPEFSVANKVETVLSLIKDIAEAKKVEENLTKQATLIDLSPDAIIVKTLDDTITFWSHGAQTLYGWTKEEALGQKSRILLNTRYAERYGEILGKLACNKRWSGEKLQKTKSGQKITVESRWLGRCNSQGKISEILETNIDITERKKAEAEREIMVEFLRIANAATGARVLIKGSLDFFQKQSGCEAVGIRLKEGEDYPYYETKGFPSEHVQIENKLCASDKDGCIIRDSKGKPVLECMCGNIICGRFDPSKKFFTENGSFWTNSTTQLIANTTAADRQGNTRNRCNSEGYESLALIVLHVGDNRLGLLQLNDKRKDMFTLETIQMWERIADRLALALSKTIAEEALRESEVKFRTVADFAYNWEYWIAPDGNMIYVSPSSQRITGYNAIDFLKDPKLLTSIVHPEDKSIVGSHFDLISSEELHVVDFRILTHSGETRWISHSCKAVFDDKGKWIGRRASNRDITERKKIEQELSYSLEESHQRESEISALLKASRAVLQNKEFQDSARAIFDACKGLIGATAGYVALLSSDGKENEVLFLDSGGLPCTVDPSLPMPIRGLRAEAYSSGKVAIENDFPSSEWQKFSPSGHVVLQNVLFAPLTIDERVVGVIGLANKKGAFTKRDAQMAAGFGEIASVALANSRMLEKLEKNEKELKGHSEHLEALVEERTKQLRDSERLAAIGTVAGMVGHDIRNPLQAITSDVYLAKTDLASMPDSEEKKNAVESLDEIEKNVAYINNIVADLQDLAKPLTLKIMETEIEKLLQYVLSNLKIPENITVTKCIPKDFPKIKADPAYLQRVLVNLVNNAIQAMPNGGKLTISATSKEGKALIIVQDTGEGMPEYVKAKIFTPLMTTKAKGQGFGLAAVKRFTEAMGGTVSFESEVGKGTKFMVQLSFA